MAVCLEEALEQQHPAIRFTDARQDELCSLAPLKDTQPCCVVLQCSTGSAAAACKPGTMSKGCAVAACEASTTSQGSAAAVHTVSTMSTAEQPVPLQHGQGLLCDPAVKQVLRFSGSMICWCSMTWGCSNTWRAMKLASSLIYLTLLAALSSMPNSSITV